MPPKKNQPDKPQTEEEKQKREKSIKAARNYRELKKKQVADQEKAVDELMKENKRLLEEETTVNNKSRDLENSVQELRRQLAAMGPSRPQTVSGMSAGHTELDISRRLSSSTVNSTHSNPAQPYAAGPLMPDLESNLPMDIMNPALHLGADIAFGPTTLNALAAGGVDPLTGAPGLDMGAGVNPADLNGFSDMLNMSDLLNAYNPGADVPLANNGVANAQINLDLVAQATAIQPTGALAGVPNNEASVLGAYNSIDSSTFANLELPGLEFSDLPAGLTAAAIPTDFPPLDLSTTSGALDASFGLGLAPSVDGAINGLPGVAANNLHTTQAPNPAEQMIATPGQQLPPGLTFPALNQYTSHLTLPGNLELGSVQPPATLASQGPDTSMYLQNNPGMITQNQGQANPSQVPLSSPTQQQQQQLQQHTPQQQTALPASASQTLPTKSAWAAQQHMAHNPAFSKESIPQSQDIASATQVQSPIQTHIHGQLDANTQQTAPTQSPVQTPDRTPAGNIEHRNSTPGSSGKVDEAATTPS